jgi:hypothetical protein
MNLLTMFYYTPGMDQDCPSWVYYSWAIGLFTYQTFDAVDGSQAYVQALSIGIRSLVMLISSLVDDEPDKVVPSANFSITVSTLSTLPSRFSSSQQP